MVKYLGSKVNEKTKKVSHTIKIIQDEVILYQVEFECCFKVETDNIYRIEYSCNSEIVNDVILSYQQLPKLSDLLKQQREIRLKYNSLPDSSKEKKVLRHQLSSINERIAKRECDFIGCSKSKIKNSYSHLPHVPNKNGMRVISGGQCYHK